MRVRASQKRINRSMSLDPTNRVELQVANGTSVIRQFVDGRQNRRSVT
jgi:hypothetical protein